MRKINFYTAHIAHMPVDGIEFRPAEGYLTNIFLSNGTRVNIAIHKLSSGGWGATDINSGIGVLPIGFYRTKKEVMCAIEEDGLADKIEKAIPNCRYYDFCVKKIKELIKKEQDFVAHLFALEERR